VRYSFMTFSVPEASLDEVLGLAKRYGYDGVEPRLQSKHGHGIETTMSSEEREQTKERVHGSGIRLSCLATSLRFAVPSQQEQTIEYANAVIDLAGDLGCPCIRVFGGNYGEETDQSGAVAQAVKGLQVVADHAGKRGVVLALETHDSFTDPEVVGDIMRRVSHPSVAVNWDVMHPVRASGYDMKQAFDVLKQWIAHVHVHDGSKSMDTLQVLPMGTGEIDHRTALRLLAGYGYNGFISGEWILSTLPEDYRDPKHLGREIAVLRRYEEEG
jgi:sugar phosphate isomerase/epimerase